MGTASRAALAAALGLALMGCENAPTEDEAPRPTFAELIDEGDALSEETFELDYTDPSTLPTEGSATYEGVVALGPDPDFGSGRVPEMAGELTIEADFGDSSLSGSAENFVTEDGEEMTGSLEVDDGRIYRDIDPEEDFTFGAIVTGDLEDEDGGRYTFGGDLLGDFLGSSHSHAEGELYGTVLTPEGAEIFAGEFVAER